MRRHGITYDTGIDPFGHGTSKPRFDPEDVRRDMAVITRDLHCDAVRVTGDDPGRLSTAAEAAAEAGLEVWFSPFPCGLSAGRLLRHLTDCAETRRTRTGPPAPRSST